MVGDGCPAVHRRGRAPPRTRRPAAGGGHGPADRGCPGRRARHRLIESDNGQNSLRRRGRQAIGRSGSYRGRADGGDAGQPGGIVGRSMRIVAVVSAVLAGVALAGCSTGSLDPPSSSAPSSSASPSPTPSPTPTPTPTPTPEPPPP